MLVVGNSCRRCFHSRICGIYLKSQILEKPKRDARMFSYSFPKLKKIHLDISNEQSIKKYISKLDNVERERLRSELEKFVVPPASSTDASQEIPPDLSQLKAVCLFNLVPFVAFGILDNVIMILAGEYIDATFGAVLGISTMAAAAWGNLVSDLAGLGTAGYVEHIGSKLGIKAPHMTPFQHDYRSTRVAAGIGRSLGITVGCILGMFPLLFINSEEIEKEKQEQILAEQPEDLSS